MQCTPAYLEPIVRKVAPKVERITGYDLGIESLRVRIVDGNDFYRVAHKAPLKRAGVNVTASTPAELRRREREILFGRMTARGSYDHATGAVFLNGNFINVYMFHGKSRCPKKYVAKEGLPEVIGHELVHRGQCRMFPEHDQYYNSCMREAFPRGLYNYRYAKRSKIQEAQVILAFTEADAWIYTWNLMEELYKSAERTLPLGNLENINRWVNKDLTGGERAMLFRRPQLIEQAFEVRPSRIHGFLEREAAAA